MIHGALESDGRVVGVDWGELGAHAAARVTFRLPPNAERAALAFVALARDEDEARAYHMLSGATVLP